MGVPKEVSRLRTLATGCDKASKVPEGIVTGSTGSNSEPEWIDQDAFIERLNEYIDRRVECVLEILENRD